MCNHHRKTGRIIKKTSTVLLCSFFAAGVIFPVRAEKSWSADISFDFTNDGKTDQDDWKALQEWVKEYEMQRGEGDGPSSMLYGDQKAEATIKRMILEQSGTEQDISYDIDVSDIPQYYLTNVNLTSPVSDQAPWATCWAFASTEILESAAAVKKAGTSGKILKEAQQDPVFITDPLSLSLSPLYLGWKSINRAENGSQKGEGLEYQPVDSETISDELLAQQRLNAGGAVEPARTILENWEGVVEYDKEPYQPLKEGEDDSLDVWGLHNERQDDEENAPLHVRDYVTMLGPVKAHVDLEEEKIVYDDYDAKQTKLMKQALIKYGSLALSYGADTTLYGDFNESGDFNYTTWSQYDRQESVMNNHMVEIVGWNDNYPKEKFFGMKSWQPPQDGAWLVKNSWGNYSSAIERWGKERVTETLDSFEPGDDFYTVMQRRYNYGIPDDKGHGTGYFWLSYYDHTISTVTAAVVDLEEDGYAYDHNYSFQHAVSSSQTPLALPVQNSDTAVMNVFQADSSEVLKAVSVDVPSPHVTVMISVYLLDDDESDSFEKMEPVLVQRAELDEMGYHTVDLQEEVPLQKGQHFAITEKITSEKDGKIYTWLNLETGIRENLQTAENTNGNFSRIVVNPKESYAYVKTNEGMRWIDASELSETDAGSVFQFGNARIHAFTSDYQSAAVNEETENEQSLSEEVPAGWLISGLAGLIFVCYLVCRSDRRKSAKRKLQQQLQKPVVKESGKKPLVKRHGYSRRRK